jgi:hypothetical protein
VVITFLEGPMGPVGPAGEGGGGSGVYEYYHLA